MSTPSFLLTVDTPAIAKSHKSFLVSSTVRLAFLAISSAGSGLRYSKHKAISAISSVTTFSKSKYLGSSKEKPFLDPTFTPVTL